MCESFLQLWSAERVGGEDGWWREVKEEEE